MDKNNSALATASLGSWYESEKYSTTRALCARLVCNFPRWPKREVYSQSRTVFMAFTWSANSSYGYENFASVVEFNFVNKRFNSGRAAKNLQSERLRRQAWEFFRSTTERSRQ